MHIFQQPTKFLCSVWLALMVLLPGQCWARPILIHNADVQGEDLSTNTLVRIYAMQKKVWSDNTPIRVFTLPNDSNLHKEFVNQYLRMQPYQLDRLWHRLVFSGTGTIPEEVSSVQEMLQKVKNTPGAIGYVDSSMIDQIDKSMMTVTPHE